MTSFWQAAQNKQSAAAAVPTVEDLHRLLNAPAHPRVIVVSPALLRRIRDAERRLR